MRLADLWLDDATSLPSGAASAVAWSRAEWVEATLQLWRTVDPVAERVGAAIGNVLPEMQAMAGPLIGMMRSMGGAMSRYADRAGRRRARGRGRRLHRHRPAARPGPARPRCCR